MKINELIPYANRLHFPGEMETLFHGGWSSLVRFDGLLFRAATELDHTISDTINSATMLMTLIIGFTAGPAVSL